jgi:hypothetical protein
MTQVQEVMRGLVLSARRDGDVLIVSARGAMSRQGIYSAQTFVRGEFRRLDSRAVVVDFSSVLHPVGWDEGLIQTFLAPGCEVVSAPVAFVVTQHAYEFMRGVAWLLAERGLIRGIFVSRAAAVAWAADRREHWTHCPGLALPASAAG